MLPSIPLRNIAQCFIYLSVLVFLIKNARLARNRMLLLQKKYKIPLDNFLPNVSIWSGTLNVAYMQKINSKIGHCTKFQNKNNVSCRFYFQFIWFFATFQLLRTACGTLDTNFDSFSLAMVWVGYKHATKSPFNPPHIYSWFSLGHKHKHKHKKKDKQAKTLTT